MLTSDKFVILSEFSIRLDADYEIYGDIVYVIVYNIYLFTFNYAVRYVQITDALNLFSIDINDKNNRNKQ